MEFFKIKASSLYGIHNPIGTKYLTRLRVGLSHLHAHKFPHRFRDTLHPICSCQNNEHETIEHFMLYCPAYRTHRAVVFEALSKSIGLVSLVNSKYVCKLLLYGDPKYSWNTNKMIIEATIEYLLTSKRFDVPLIHDQ